MQSEIHNLQHIGPLVLSFRYFGLISSPRLCLDSGEILERKGKKEVTKLSRKRACLDDTGKFYNRKKNFPANVILYI